MTSKATHNPHAILTDNLVEEALANDVGPEARLQSYKVVDFTKKGDNFASFVTSVQVNYDLGGEKYQRSYITKLNSGLLTDKYMKQFFIKAYLREPIILGPIRDMMNEELIKLNLPLIRTPRCLSSCDIYEKEVLLAEDLRQDGFVMFDKYKGMDLKHASFVMKELGRFHASSILVENRLKNKSFEKTYPLINDENFTNPDFEGLGSLSMVMGTQFNTCVEILELFGKYDHVIRWFENIRRTSSQYYFRHSDPSEKFNVLIHGDCWTTNMLFKYNSEGEPIDIRLVDLQLSRMSSPAADLNYFFYSSLAGDVRQKHKKTLLTHYYLSFIEVLMLAGQKVPFTFEELLSEFQSRMAFGCIAAMMILPTTLAKPEDAIQLNEFGENESETTIEKRKRFIKMAFKSPVVSARILTMFDEMTEAGVFDNARTIFNPYKIITEDLIENAVRADLGNDAKFVAFEVRDFTKKGDNYASSVVCAKVEYDFKGVSDNTTYVIKMNPERPVSGITIFFEAMYLKEPLILSTIAKGLNKELDVIGQPPIKFPTVLAIGNEKSKEVLITHNLRLEGFIMYDRKKGMDVPHSLFIMKELGRLHASSLLYEKALGRPIPLQFEKEFDESWNYPETPTFIMMSQIIEGQIDGTIPLLNGQKGYENVPKWIDSIRKTAMAKFFPRYNPDNRKFNVLIHGDCWNNNIMFKYDESGNPVDVRLVDLQFSRVDSAVLDLIYFFYTSLDGGVRQENRNLFLITYYLSFCEILLMAEKAVPFHLRNFKMKCRKICGMDVLLEWSFCPLY